MGVATCNELLSDSARSGRHVLPLLEGSAWSEDSGRSWDGGVTLPVDRNPVGISDTKTKKIGRWLIPLFSRCSTVRWSLSRSVFSVSLPLLTAHFDLKVGDLVLTLPSIVILAGSAALRANERDVAGSGTPPTIALLLVFGFVVRNNSVLLALTGIPFDRALFYHKLFAVVAIFLAAIHGGAYVLARADDEQERDGSSLVTGLVAFAAMIMLFALSLSVVRRRCYEHFVRMHWILFILVLVCALIHGAGFALVGIVPWQIDMIYRVVYRTRIYEQGSLVTMTNEQSNSAESYASVVEVLKKPVRRGIIARDQVSICQLPGNITRIRFPRIRADTGEEFKHKPGQYAFLCIPAFSSLAWHPFSISSSPHEGFVTFHIKAVGDWTNALYEAASESVTDSVVPFDILVDGPYGSLSIDIESPATYSHYVALAAGMGVTPIRSIVNWLHNECYFQRGEGIQRVHFVWSVGDCETIRAFLNKETTVVVDHPTKHAMISYLPGLLRSPMALNEPTDTFFSQIHLTQGVLDVDQQLQKCVWYGSRPATVKILREMGEHAKQSGRFRVAVLVCGPPAMVKDVITATLKLSEELKVQFDVHTQQFAL
ncbi:hypothetical protein BBJ28_00006323 [Nothophytophthora sp. Chile5]|nr:hypothetical protein BBJ28_00006323 [Nothophytophthora sp. Chile5]